MRPVPPRPFTFWVEKLARDHTRTLAVMAQREGLAADDALDAVQEAFATLLSLPQARSLASDPEDAASLLAVIVRNAARNARRRHHHAREHVTIDPTDHIDDAPSIDELIAAAEEHASVLGCVHQLSEVQRHVMTLRVLDELSGAEAARTLGLTQGHIAVLLHRAKAALRQCLDG